MLKYAEKTDDFCDYRASFEKFAENRGIRLTPQREAIIAELYHASRQYSPKHYSIDELHMATRVHFPKLGLATVYRTVRLLVEAGLARELQTGDNLCRYEAADAKGHGHLICRNCGQVIDIMNPKLEFLKKKFFSDYNFFVEGQMIVFHGVCEHCHNTQYSNPPDDCACQTTPSNTLPNHGA